ncbi:MAG: class I SAM-dependent methyltransferase [Candidatus Rokuibacteriota bacterium]
MCESPAVEHVVSIPGVPVYCNVQWETRAEALTASRGDIDLVFCASCGHVFNRAFDPLRVEYSTRYENSLHFSGRFKEYADELADRLVGKYGLRGKDVIEVGCGKGEFLALLCERGGNRGLGFDASYVPDGELGTDRRGVTVVQEPFGDPHTVHAADLVCCRQVLEHVRCPRELLELVQRVLARRPGAVTYFEVPNALFTLRHGGIWDLIYEHCSYFTPESLATAFERAGCTVLEIYEAFDGQYLGVEATADNGDQPHTRDGDRSRVETLGADVRAFERRYQHQLRAWRARLERARADRERVAVWGAGSKGVTFLNVLGVAEEVESVVDVNPRKQGRFVPGTGHRIVPPEALVESRPDLVLVMNRIYEAEIGATLRGLGLGPAVQAV